MISFMCNAMKTVNKKFVDLMEGGMYLGRMMSSSDWFEMFNPKEKSLRMARMSEKYAFLVAKVEFEDVMTILSFCVAYDMTTGRYFLLYWSHRVWTILDYSYVLSDLFVRFYEHNK